MKGNLLNDRLVTEIKVNLLKNSKFIEIIGNLLK